MNDQPIVFYKKHSSQFNKYLRQFVKAYHTLLGLSVDLTECMWDSKNIDYAVHLNYGQPLSGGIKGDFRYNVVVKADNSFIDFTINGRDSFGVMTETKLTLSISKNNPDRNICETTYRIEFKSNNKSDKYSHGLIDFKMVGEIEARPPIVKYSERFKYITNNLMSHDKESIRHHDEAEMYFKHFQDLLEFINGYYGVMRHCIFFSMLFRKVENVLNKKCRKIKLDQQ